MLLTCSLNNEEKLAFISGAQEAIENIAKKLDIKLEHKNIKTLAQEISSIVSKKLSKLHKYNSFIYWYLSVVNKNETVREGSDMVENFSIFFTERHWKTNCMNTKKN